MVRSDSDIEYAKEIYEVAQKEANIKLQKMESELDSIRDESRALGILQKINYDNSHNELIKYAVLFKIKQSKQYKKGGMTWPEFCAAIGESVRTIDENLADVRPLFEKFSAESANLVKVPFSKIRYLGRSISAESAEIKNNALIIDDMEIPLTPENRDEIEAAIDTLKESHKREKNTLESTISNLEKNQQHIIEAETEALKIEKESLVKEVQRLKAYDPEGESNEYFIEKAEEIRQLAEKLDSTIRRFIVPEKIREDEEVVVQIAGRLVVTKRLICNLQLFFEREFMLDED